MAAALVAAWAAHAEALLLAAAVVLVAHAADVPQRPLEPAVRAGDDPLLGTRLDLRRALAHEEEDEALGQAGAGTGVLAGGHRPTVTSAATVERMTAARMRAVV